MPVNLQIIRACEFVRLDANGRFDCNGTLDVLIVLARACQKRSVYQALLDVRGATSDLTPNDLAGLAEAFSKTPVSRRLRLAILHGGNQTYRAKLFAFINGMRRHKVRAFQSYEEAFEWLSSTSEPGSSEGEVPIRVLKQSRP